MMPKIEFRYVSVYDRIYRESPVIKQTLKRQNKSYPSWPEIKNYISKVEKIWRKKEKIILAKIESITKFKWREKKVICYVIGFGGAISDPLTVSIKFEKPSTFIDVLVHELIHKVQSQNKDKYSKWAVYVKNKYLNETITTNSHIALHAIHHQIYLHLFTKKQLKEDIERHEIWPDYKRAWEIVLQEGPENILKKFHEVTK
jgi:hypothetical protein